jgi:hypothetical protein
VLVRGQEFTPLTPGYSCLSRIHGHCSYGKAAEMVEHGMADWVRTEYLTVRGKPRTRVEMAIRLVRKRRWVPTPSRDERGTMKVCQLVV